MEFAGVETNGASAADKRTGGKEKNIYTLADLLISRLIHSLALPVSGIHNTTSVSNLPKWGELKCRAYTSMFEELRWRRGCCCCAAVCILHRAADVCGAAAANCRLLRLMFVLECRQSRLEKSNPPDNPLHL